MECPKCKGRGVTLQLEINWATRTVAAEPVSKLCPKCEGSGEIYWSEYEGGTTWFSH